MMFENLNIILFIIRDKDIKNMKTNTSTSFFDSIKINKNNIGKIEDSLTKFPPPEALCNNQNIINGIMRSIDENVYEAFKHINQI